MKVSYLVRWKPYQILRTLHEGETCEIPEGCDIIKTPLSFSDEHIEKWNGNIDWNKVLMLHENKKYFEIFLMHNHGKWTDEHYCCERFEKHVDYNVELYKNTERKRARVQGAV